LWRWYLLWRILSVRMRRLLAMTIALLLSFTLAAPLFDVSASATVPECCRRNGQHHCMGAAMGAGVGSAVGSMTSDPGSDPAFSGVAPQCPRFPVASPAPQPHSVVPHWAQTAGIPFSVRPASLREAEAQYRVSYARSRQKRGPPVIHL
jgi:hypothetical protein